MAQEATGSNGTRWDSLTNASCAPCKGNCDCIHTGKAQAGRLKTWMAELEPEPSTAMSKLHFPASFHLGKCRDVDGNRLCISPAPVSRKTIGQISHKLIFTVISLVYLYHSWLQFPSSVHLGVLSCLGISVLSAGSCWSYQGSLANNPLQNTNKRILM